MDTWDRYPITGFWKFHGETNLKPRQERLSFIFYKLFEKISNLLLMIGIKYVTDRVPDTLVSEEFLSSSSLFSQCTEVGTIELVDNDVP